MLPERVDAMLRDYKGFVGRCGHIRVAVAAMARQLTAMQESLADDLTSTGSQNDGMPHGTTVGNPTERAGLMLASGYKTQEMIDVEAEIKALEDEYDEKIITVHFVKAWLMGLTAKEQWMVGQQIFDGLCYREINHNYRGAFGENCSKDLLRRLRKEALAKIYAMAE